MKISRNIEKYISTIQYLCSKCLLGSLYMLILCYILGMPNVINGVTVFYCMSSLAFVHNPVHICPKICIASYTAYWITVYALF